MAKEPFLPLFFGDFLASTAEWEGEEQGLYLLLLGYQWSLGSLPTEPRRVCKLVGWDWQLFERCWGTVGAKFEANAGRLLNQRLEQHRAKTHEISGKRAASGSLGGKTAQANARHAREQMLDSDKAIARNLLDPPSHPIPSHPNPSKPESEKSKRGEGAASRKRSATATRLPEDFELTEQRRAIAKSQGADPDREFENFTDHWKAASGANARKHDWDATWRIWCRRAPDFRPNGNGSNGRRPHKEAPTTAELEAREVARLAGEGRSVESIAQEIGLSLERARELVNHAGH